MLLSHSFLFSFIWYASSWQFICLIYWFLSLKKNIIYSYKRHAVRILSECSSRLMIQNLVGKLNPTNLQVFFVLSPLYRLDIIRVFLLDKITQLCVAFSIKWFSKKLSKHWEGRRRREQLELIGNLCRNFNPTSSWREFGILDINVPIKLYVRKSGVNSVTHEKLPGRKFLCLAAIQATSPLTGCKRVNDSIVS